MTPDVPVLLIAGFAALVAWIIRSWLARRHIRAALARAHQRRRPAVAVADTSVSDIMSHPTWPKCGRLVTVINGQPLMCAEPHLHQTVCSTRVFRMPVTIGRDNAPWLDVSQRSADSSTATPTDTSTGPDTSSSPESGIPSGISRQAREAS